MRKIISSGISIEANSEVVTCIRIRGEGFKYGVEVEHFETFLSDKEIEDIGQYILCRDHFLIEERANYPRYPLYIMRQLISKGK